MTLKTAWRKQLELRAEGDKLWTAAGKLWAEGDQRSAEAKKLWAEANELWAEVEELRDEGDERWSAAIRKARGNIDFEWVRRGDVLDCVLSTGEVFRGDEPSDGG